MAKCVHTYYIYNKKEVQFFIGFVTEKCLSPKILEKCQESLNKYYSSFLTEVTSAQSQDLRVKP